MYYLLTTYVLVLLTYLLTCLLYAAPGGSTGKTSGHVGGAVQVARDLQVHLPRERARRAQQTKPRVGEENPQVPGRAMLTSSRTCRILTPTEGSPPLGLG